MVVGKTDQAEIRQLSSLAALLCLYKSGKLPEKLVGSKLVGILDLEIRVPGIEVLAQLGLGCHVVGWQRNRKLVRTLPTSQFHREVLTRLYLCESAVFWMTGR